MTNDEIIKLAIANRALILDALLTLRFRRPEDLTDPNSGEVVLQPCIDARSWLGGGVGPGLGEGCLYDWVHWLGVALCQAGALEWPVFSIEDLEDSASDPRYSATAAWTFKAARVALWYWHAPTLIWECREYVRRRDGRGSR
jgi:hypothetical protein